MRHLENEGLEIDHDCGYDGDVKHDSSRFEYLSKRLVVRQRRWCSSTLGVIPYINHNATYTSQTTISTSLHRDGSLHGVNDGRGAIHCYDGLSYLASSP